MKSIITSFLFVVFVVRFCASQQPMDFLLLNLQAITERQDTILLKIDESDKKTEAQQKDSDRKTEAQQEELESRLNLLIQDSERKTKAQLKELESKLNLLIQEFQKSMEENVCLEEVQKCATHEQLDIFRNSFIKDECAEGSHKCHPSATCVDTSVNYVCSCMEGYTGDGFTCQETSNVSRDEQICVNQTGNYSFQCPAGYTKVGDTCQELRCESPSKVFPGLGCVIPVENKLPGDAARNYCIKTGGRLLEEIEREDILLLSQHFMHIQSSTCPWIGHQLGVWLESGNQIPSSLWGGGHGPGTNKDCGGVCLSGSSSPFYFTSPCIYPRTFLCQILH